MSNSFRTPPKNLTADRVSRGPSVHRFSPLGSMIAKEFKQPFLILFWKAKAVGWPQGKSHALELLKKNTHR